MTARRRLTHVNERGAAGGPRSASSSRQRSTGSAAWTGAAGLRGSARRAPGRAHPAGWPRAATRPGGVPQASGRRGGHAARAAKGGHAARGVPQPSGRVGGLSRRARRSTATDWLPGGLPIDDSITCRCGCHKRRSSAADPISGRLSRHLTRLPGRGRRWGEPGRVPGQRRPAITPATATSARVVARPRVPGQRRPAITPATATSARVVARF